MHEKTRTTPSKRNYKTTSMIDRENTRKERNKILDEI